MVRAVIRYGRKPFQTPGVAHAIDYTPAFNLRRNFHRRKPINYWFTDVGKFAPEPAISMGGIGQMGKSNVTGRAFVLSKLRVNTLHVPTPPQSEKVGPACLN
jgi:hypothetical protein